MPLILLMGLAVGAINGISVVFTRVPDIVVTLAFFFIWEGAALMVVVLLLVFSLRSAGTQPSEEQ